MPLVLNVSSGHDSHILVTGNLFLKNASVILSAPRWRHTTTTTGVDSFVITGNMFSCKSDPSFGACEREAVILDQTGSHFGSVRNTKIEDNRVDNDAGYRSTKARRTVRAENTSSVLLDFSQDLLFPSAPLINGSATCTLINGNPVTHSLRLGPDELSGLTSLQLRVDFGQTWSGQVQCTVDQSEYSQCAL